MARITSCHHVLGVEHLLREFGDGERPVLLAPPGGEGGEPGHEEVEAGKGDHVHRELPQIGVQLTCRIRRINSGGSCAFS